uniref:Uncharacterized protein n=1 Tax=viral metagenome TaxID=1070528 RepID=A0A6M3JRT8_9ZZZZ
MPKPIENKPSAAYCFDKRGRLVGIQDVTGWSLAQLVEFCRSQKRMDRRAVVSSHGRAICDACRIDLGARPDIPAGQVSHGKCPVCYEAALREIEAFNARAMLPAETEG